MPRGTGNHSAVLPLLARVEGQKQLRLRMPAAASGCAWLAAHPPTARRCCAVRSRLYPPGPSTVPAVLLQT